MATRKLRIAFKDKRPNVILLQDRISRTSKHSLRPALRARRVTPYSRNIQPIPKGSVLINFGATEIPAWVRPDMVFLNTPDAIRDSSNKYHTFVKLKEANVPHVRWTTSADDVKGWLNKGHKVLCRTRLSSSGGRGINVLEPHIMGAGQGAGAGGGEQNTPEIPTCPLYTRYFPKTHEFRVHVVDGKAIDLTEKKLRNDLKEKEHDRLIRSHDRGWVHAHDNLSITDLGDIEALRSLAINAIRAVGLDFGAVDILACLSDDSPRRLTKSVVCEVNAAPGIENTNTQQAYTKALNELITKRVG